MAAKYDELMRMTAEGGRHAALEASRVAGRSHRQRNAEIRLPAARYPLLMMLFPSLSRPQRWAKPRPSTATEPVALAAELHCRRTALIRRRSPNSRRAICRPSRWTAATECRCATKLADGKPLIYSIAGDRDDDGGVPRPASAATTKPAAAPASVAAATGPAAPDGDWILWPPVEEPAPPPGTYPGDI